MVQSFTQLYFGKAIDDVTADDVTAFFAEERPEGINLEFKSFAQHESDLKLKEKGVIRTVCAFLNSEGGLLIWGAPEGTKNDRGDKVFVGKLSPVTKYYNKDSFISKLITRIEDIPSGIRFKDVEVSQDQYVYLIDVPESSIKPHQFEDRYWTRFDGQSKAAPHYLIRALFREEKKPVLKATLSVDSESTKLVDDSRFAMIEFGVRVENLVEEINEDKAFVTLTSLDGEFFVTEGKSATRANQFIKRHEVGVLSQGVEMTFDVTYCIDRDNYRGRRIIPFTIKLVAGGLRSKAIQLIKKYRVAFLPGRMVNEVIVDVRELAEGEELT
ncbi:AlbA family DNA-binding domain-containing protein [Fibrivirga algicola]|uniref:ATP-binding protein n=1 Tax=Fibrivirga algicola TaxID=2950420 RepID=A0ABX0QJ01_9BACT|nr:ATP-binding protein [Fibrivirga algicola]NID10638.1 ATP-binding protein [Fibrivirga algicola]